MKVIGTSTEFVVLADVSYAIITKQGVTIGMKSGIERRLPYADPEDAKKCFFQMGDAIEAGE